MKKTGWKTAIIAVLVVAVVSSLALAAWGGRGRGGRRGLGYGRDLPGGPRMGPQLGAMGPGGPGMLGRGRGRDGYPMPLMMLRRLDLTDEQVDAIKKIVEESKEKSEAAIKAVAEATKGLHETVTEGDEAKIREAATNLGKAIGDQAVLKAATMASVKEVLTDEQLKELEELKAKMKERAEKLPEEMKGPEFGPRFQRFGRRGGSWGAGQDFGRGPIGEGFGPPRRR